MPGVPATAAGPVRGGPAGRGGFGQVLRAEWTKFRTVRGWAIGVIVAPLVTVAWVIWSRPGSRAARGRTRAARRWGPAASR